MFHNSLDFYFTALRDSAKRRAKEHCILILGCGEAGKSTFIKQMQIIHANGLGDNKERLEKKPLIAANIYSAIFTLIDMSIEMSIDPPIDDNEELKKALGR